MRIFSYLFASSFWLVTLTAISSLFPFNGAFKMESHDSYFSKTTDSLKAEPKVNYPVKPYSNDPIRMGLQVNKPMPRVGEAIEITITARYLNLPPSVLFTFEGSNEFRLKVIVPEGFVVTGGTYHDYVGDQLSANHPLATYTIQGYFTEIPDQPQFRLLRGTGQANAQSLFVEKAQLSLKVSPSRESAARTSTDACDGISLSASASSNAASCGSSVQLTASCSGCGTGGGNSTLYSTNFDNDTPNSSFVTDFTDQVAVVNNAQVNSGETYYCPITDHSGTNGKLLRFTGEPAGRIWEKSLSVTSGTTYTFSFWVKPMYNGTPAGTTQRDILLQANSATIGSQTVTLANPGCSNGWVQLTASWQATSTGSVPFTIRINGASSWQNSFALDDISISSAGSGSSATYSWQALNGGTIQSASSASTQVNLPSTAGSYPYKVTMTTNNGCTLEQTVTVVTSCTTTSVCSGISLSASASSNAASCGSSVQLTASCSGCGTGGGSTLYSTNFDNDTPNSSFATDFTDQVAVVTNAQLNAGEAYCPITDHSGTNGKLLRFTGEPAGRIWEKSLSVTSGTTYTFSFWVKPMYNGTPAGTSQRTVLLQANNATIGSQVVTLANPGCSNGWVQLTASWQATSTGSVPFTIRINGASSWQNSFALDDISISSAGSGSSATYSWQALNGGTIQSASSASTQVNLPSTAGSYPYKVTMTTNNGCTLEQTVTVTTSCTTISTIPYNLPTFETFNYEPITTNQSWPASDYDHRLYDGTHEIGDKIVLDNGQVRAELWKNWGGSVAHISVSGTGVNLINQNKDKGRGNDLTWYRGGRTRQVESENKPINSAWASAGGSFDLQNGGVGNDPISIGDVFGNPSPVVAVGRSNDGTMVYVKTRMMNWAVENDATDMYREHWVSLSGKEVRVRSRLTANRTMDTTHYEARPQEYPNLYTIAPLATAAYVGGDGAIHYLANGNQQPFRIAEPWVAMVNGSSTTSTGVGLFRSGLYEINQKLQGGGGTGEFDNAAGYTTASQHIQSDWNGVYYSDHSFYVGSVSEIQSWANAKANPRNKLSWKFNNRNGRGHFWFHVCHDTGFPTPNTGIVVSPDDSNGRHEITWPDVSINSSAVSQICIRYKASTNYVTSAQLFVGQTDDSPQAMEQRSATFSIINDNQWHTATIPMSSVSNYGGKISRVVFRGNNAPTNSTISIAWVNTVDADPEP